MFKKKKLISGETKPKGNQFQLLNSNEFEEFPWLDYLLINTDLVENNIMSKIDAFMHWKNYGQKEKRSIHQQWFNWISFLLANPKVMEKNIHTKKDAYFYYIQHPDEQYQTQFKFNSYHYYLLYKDLQDNNIKKDEDLKIHYIEFGFKEGRQCYIEDFDYVFYIYFHCFLEEGIKNETQALVHYINYGKKEGRVCNIKDFEKQYHHVIFQEKSSTPLKLDNVHYFDSFVPDSNLKEKELQIVEKRDSPFFKANLKINYDFIYQRIPDENKYILIVDFPCYGGGASFFINSIISKYKSVNQFIIVRCVHNQYYYYLNDEEIIHYPTQKELAIPLIDKLNSYISKIFVNSFLKHDLDFIQKILTLGKELTTITHDLTICFDKPHEYMHNIHLLEPIHQYRLKSFNTVLTQNEENIYLYQDYWSSDQKKIIVDLPDYKRALKKVQCNHNKIVIGIIGNISDVKGYYVVYQLIYLSQCSENIDLVIFGRMNVNYDKKFVYKNIEELNALLEAYQPNIIFETSLWPESYSYTLSLAMITNLPIFYQDKKYNSTVINRLKKYKKSYPFWNVNEIRENDLLNIKQDWFYTIDPTIYFPSFYDEYFGKTNHEYRLYDNVNNLPNLIIITSKIITTNKPFNYINIRSKFSSEERFEQTLKTIMSVRKFIPNSFIVLFDNSDLPEQQEFQIKSLVNCYINPINDTNLNEITNNSPNKMYGEISQTYKILEYLENYYKGLTFKQFFKISGRYLVNNTFDFNVYDNTSIIMKKNPFLERPYYYTSFYKISPHMFSFYKEVIHEIYSGIPENKYDEEELEVLFPKLLNNQFECISNLGITQNIAVWDDTSNI